MEELRSAWPLAFPVCAQHKAEFFADYDGAYIDEENCILHYPRESDSLGG